MLTWCADSAHHDVPACLLTTSACSPTCHPVPPPFQCHATALPAQNGDGLLSKDELAMALRSIGRSGSETSVDHLMRLADNNRDGQLDYAEFMRMAREQHEVSLPPANDLDVTSNSAEEAIKRKMGLESSPARRSLGELSRPPPLPRRNQRGSLTHAR